ncbi:unnamed protein product [Rangifer tarandus platyrhynchus]|uniref:Uncharacterized protein n=1 Tax=Rangifer tarandus platyrhynchus TaxID=3082113 RepID=A0ABN8YCI9_RANTA|nr:unnamed protein product [Rangifer tarandus platyrhynchus]
MPAAPSSPRDICGRQGGSWKLAPPQPWSPKLPNFPGALHPSLAQRLPKGYQPPKAIPAPHPPALSASQRSSTPSQASDDGKEAEAWPHPGDRNLRLGDRSGAEWSRALGRWPPGLTERMAAASCQLWDPGHISRWEPRHPRQESGNGGPWVGTNDHS